MNKQTRNLLSYFFSLSEFLPNASQGNHWSGRITRTCLVSGIILLSVARWALILSRRRRSASLWIFRALASVALLPDPDDDDISGGATRSAGGDELACRGRWTSPLNAEGAQASYDCSSFPCRGWHAAISPKHHLASPAGSFQCNKKPERVEWIRQRSSCTRIWTASTATANWKNWCSTQ